MSAERVMKLVMLASSPNENEARTAAFLACKAIREGGLLIVSSEDPRLRGRAAPPPPPPPPPRPKEPPPKPKEPPPVKRRLISVLYESWCKTCRVHLPVGTEAWWAANQGVVCRGCHR